MSDPDPSPERYPTSSNTSIQAATTAEILAAYEGYGPEVRTLLSCSENPTKWNIHVVYPHIPPEQWVKGGVTILGDAVSTAILPLLMT